MIANGIFLLMSQVDFVRINPRPTASPTRVLGRILKVGVQNLKQGVQVQWTTITDVSVGRVCHVAGQFCAVAI